MCRCMRIDWPAEKSVGCAQPVDAPEPSYADWISGTGAPASRSFAQVYAPAPADLPYSVDQVPLNEKASMNNDPSMKKRRLHWVVLVVVGLSVSPFSQASDFTADQVRELLEKADGQRPADLAGKDLSDLDLSNVDFKRANLSGASLFASRLVSSNLAGARLARANLNGAWLMGATFAGANLSGSSMLGLVILGGSVPQDRPAAVFGELQSVLVFGSARRTPQQAAPIRRFECHSGSSHSSDAPSAIPDSARYTA
jgi:Pentapeptide repeats (8 copies)